MSKNENVSSLRCTALIYIGLLTWLSVHFVRVMAMPLSYLLAGGVGLPRSANMLMYLLYAIMTTLVVLTARSIMKWREAVAAAPKAQEKKEEEKETTA